MSPATLNCLCHFLRHRATPAIQQIPSTSTTADGSLWPTGQQQASFHDVSRPSVFLPALLCCHNSTMIQNETWIWHVLAGSPTEALTKVNQWGGVQPLKLNQRTHCKYLHFARMIGFPAFAWLKIAVLFLATEWGPRTASRGRSSDPVTGPPCQFALWQPVGRLLISFKGSTQ